MDTTTITEDRNALRQKLFNKAYLGLKAQEFKPSWKNIPNRYGDMTDTCMYRGQEGLKCAVGHLIDDKFYDPSIEAKSATNKDIETAICRSQEINLSYDDLDFLNRLQRAHDIAMPGKYSKPMEPALKQFALEENLTIPE